MRKKVFPAQLSALDDVMAAVEEFLEELSCPMKTQMSLCLAIEEVFVNVVNYAYVNNVGEVDMQMDYCEETGTVTFVMTDHGVAFDPLNMEDPDVTLSAEDREIGGLGIYIVKKTMDALSYRYELGANILTMEKRI